MKRFHTMLSLGAVALVLMLLVAGTACTNSDMPRNDTEDSSVSMSEPPSTLDEMTIENTEPMTDEDEDDTEIASEPDADLSVENAVVVLSSYASEWERTCADALATELGLEVVEDEKAPSDKSWLIIGYAKQNGVLSSDINVLGNLGYIVEANDGNVTVLANTEAGLTSAIEALHGLLEAGRVIPSLYQLYRQESV